MKYKLGFALLVLLLLYLLFWPVPVSPRSWQAPVEQGYVGEFSPNQKLQQFDSIGLGGLHGPEAAVISTSGLLYTSTHEGWILRGAVDAEKLERWVNLGGRPLGMSFDADGDLWVANAYHGLQRVKPDGRVITELTEADGVAIRYADDVVVAPSGKIYFSDASTKFSAEQWGGTLPASLLDLMEHGGHGRIIEYDPVSMRADVIMQGLDFANGVAVDPQGRYLLVAETGTYSVSKYWLLGPDAGKTEVIIANLPGFPDNVLLGQQGRFWVGLTAPRSPALDKLSASPFVRKIVQRLPPFLRPKVVHYGMVIAIDGNGNVLANLQAPDGEAFATTGVMEDDQYLFVTSLTMPVLPRYRKAEIGL